MNPGTIEGLRFGLMLALVVVLTVALAVIASVVLAHSMERGAAYTIRGAVCTDLEAMRTILAAGKASGQPVMAQTHERMQQLEGTDGRPMCAFAQGMVIPVATHDSGDVPGMGRVYIIEAKGPDGMPVFMFDRSPVSEPGRAA